ncbi:hypothetical protein [Succinivibrio sp.]|uniref:hypothetical protein n=1 Tax=Succinivibrio sp. TaxID=2053619 RepID=UPI0025F35DD6|nr:hypothetical protein [Succinivibrio sp.]MBQ9220462.1 hypothetical protein [Succinivibrio sp.]
MSNILLGKLEEITDLRFVWKDEARDFTPWLAQNENIDILGQTLGIDINVESTESSVGDFSADIYAKVSNSDEGIIIENQLEQSDHDHLGKICKRKLFPTSEYLIKNRQLAVSHVGYNLFLASFLFLLHYFHV